MQGVSSEAGAALNFWLLLGQAKSNNTIWCKPESREILCKPPKEPLYLPTSFLSLSKDSQLRTDVALMDMATRKIVNPNMRQIFLELPRFTKEANECKDNLERWLYLIKNMGNLQDMPFMEERTEWNDLSRLASVAAMSKKEREAYEISLKHYRDYYNSIEYAKYEASKEGREEHNTI